MASEQEQVASSNTPSATETSSIEPPTEPPTDNNSIDDASKVPNLMDVTTANNFEPALKKSKNEEMQPIDQSTPSVSNQYGDNYNGERGNISQYESPYKNPGDVNDTWHQNEPNRDYRSESRYDSYSYQHSNPPQRSTATTGNADPYKDGYRSNYDIPPTTQPNSSMASMGPTPHSYTSTDNRYPAQKGYDDYGRGNSLKSFYGESWNSYKNPPEKDFIGDTTDSHGYPSGKERWSGYDNYQRRDNDPNLSSTARNHDNTQYPDPNYQRHSDSWYGEPSRHREQSAYSEQRAPKRTLESHALKSFFGSSLDTYYNPPENDYIGNSSDQPRGQDKDGNQDRDQFYEEMANYEASKISGNQDYDAGFTPDCPQVKKPDYKSKEAEEGPTEDDFWNDPPDNLLASPPEDSDEEQKTEEHIPEDVPVTPAYEDKKDDYHSQQDYEAYREGYNNEPHAKNDYEEQANNYEEEYRSYYQSKCDKTYNTDHSNYENRDYSNYDNSNYENSEYVDQNNSYKNSSYDDRYETNYSSNSAPYYGDPNNVGNDGYPTNQNPSQQYNAY